jgi:hypothetical protein
MYSTILKLWLLTLHLHNAYSKQDIYLRTKFTDVDTNISLTIGINGKIIQISYCPHFVLRHSINELCNGKIHIIRLQWPYKMPFSYAGALIVALLTFKLTDKEMRGNVFVRNETNCCGVAGIFTPLSELYLASNNSMHCCHAWSNNDWFQGH